jgi:hypothetical protein
MICCDRPIFIFRMISFEDVFEQDDDPHWYRITSTNEFKCEIVKFRQLEGRFEFIKLV